MIGILLITHNGLGDSLVDCVRHVLGGAPSNLKVLSMQAGDDPNQKESEARALIAQLDSGNGVLMLSDLYGSTPCNMAQRLYEPGRIEGLSGVNLPMLLRALNYSAKPLSDVLQKALDSGRGCIIPLNSDSGCCDVETRCADR